MKRLIAPVVAVLLAAPLAAQVAPETPPNASEAPSNTPEAPDATPEAPQDAPAITPQDAPATSGGDPDDLQQGLDLLSEGVRQLLRGLVGEVEPRMRQLAEALENFNFDGIGIDDLGAYHPPEMLPNGDIILRRREDRPVDSPMDSEIDI